MGDSECMGDCEQIRCCGREMTVIGVERQGSGLQLHSCPSCGRHAWWSGGRAVGRSELLEALQVVRPAKARPAAVVAVAPDHTGRRADLLRLLEGFTAHGSSS